MVYPVDLATDGALLKDFQSEYQDGINNNDIEAMSIFLDEHKAELLKLINNSPPRSFDNLNPVKTKVKSLILILIDLKSSLRAAKELSLSFIESLSRVCYRTSSAIANTVFDLTLT